MSTVCQNPVTNLKICTFASFHHQSGHHGKPKKGQTLQMICQLWPLLRYLHVEVLVMQRIQNQANKKSDKATHFKSTERCQKKFRLMHIKSFATVMSLYPSHNMYLKQIKVWETHSVTQLLKRAVCNGPTGFVQTDFPVVNIHNSRSCYCGEKHKVSTLCDIKDCHFCGNTDKMINTYQLKSHTVILLKSQLIKHLV